MIEKVFSNYLTFDDWENDTEYHVKKDEKAKMDQYGRFVFDINQVSKKKKDRINSNVGHNDMSWGDFET
jgi:hypothetical protein